MSSVATELVSLRLLRAGIIEIHCAGQLDGQHTSYLPDLAHLIEQQPAHVDLVFETMEVVHFTPAWALSHVEFLRAQRTRIRRIAVVFKLRSVPLSIAAVSISAGLEIKGFSTLAQGLDWLES